MRSDKKLFVTGFPYTYLDMPNGPLEVFSKFIRTVFLFDDWVVRRLILCWVAAGRFDGFYEHKLRRGIVLPVSLIVEEAGGKVTDSEGNSYDPYQPGL